MGTFVLTQIDSSNFVFKLDRTVHERMLAGSLFHELTEDGKSVAAHGALQNM